MEMVKWWSCLTFSKHHAGRIQKKKKKKVTHSGTQKCILYTHSQATSCTGQRDCRLEVSKVQMASAKYKSNKLSPCPWAAKVIDEGCGEKGRNGVALTNSLTLFSICPVSVFVEQCVMEVWQRVREGFQLFSLITLGLTQSLAAFSRTSHSKILILYGEVWSKILFLRGNVILISSTERENKLQTSMWHKPQQQTLTMTQNICLLSLGNRDFLFKELDLNRGAKLLHYYQSKFEPHLRIIIKSSKRSNYKNKEWEWCIDQKNFKQKTISISACLFHPWPKLQPISWRSSQDTF